MKNCEKYDVGYFPPPVKSNDWINKDHITKAPAWCSVDLRDGNQALIVPMSLDEKIDFFKFLVSLGFKEIEVGFPAASETEYTFLRTLVEDNMVPDDVTIQVLTQSREHIIKKTFESLIGVKNAVVHLYNSTSVAQREQVFKMEKEEIIDIAVSGATLIEEYAKNFPDTNFTFEYSPESFTGTEMEFALEICNRVIDVWKPRPERKVIINLPATVAMSMPHVYASQIEYMSKNLHDRENVILSLHPHNDRGTAVADCELGLLAGGDRIEGTLFGNGERTGNADIITVAMNMYSHGVDPGLDFTDMPAIVAIYEKFTDLEVHPRQPYGGQLVFAAFSGSHQDAIAKGMRHRKSSDSKKWNVPYLPIDPHDVGREYDADVIRINSQSGKGGVAYVLEQNYGFFIPKEMREELGYMIKEISDKQHKELSPEEIYEYFDGEYINRFDEIDITDAEFKRPPHSEKMGDSGMTVDMNVLFAGKHYALSGKGNGRLDSVTNALRQGPYELLYDFVTYSEHALESESDSRAASYVAIKDRHGFTFWGVGIHNDIIYASVNALVSAINRAFIKNHPKGQK
ncbi:MAG: 2-isopropylmalate synthase [Clostridiales bacterium]|nr:2-isopropylmalate synthase [Clostridiales bacterium]